MSRMERLVSDHMIHSKNESAHVQSFIEADITDIWDWKKRVQNKVQDSGVRSSLSPCIHNACRKSSKKI